MFFTFISFRKLRALYASINFSDVSDIIPIFEVFYNAQQNYLLNDKFIMEFFLKLECRYFIYKVTERGT